MYDLPYGFTEDDLAYFTDPNDDFNFSDWAGTDLSEDFLHGIADSGDGFDLIGTLNGANDPWMNQGIGGDSSWLTSILSGVGKAANGFADVFTGGSSGNSLIDSLVKAGITGYGLYNSDKNMGLSQDSMRAAIDAKKAEIELARGKDANDWTSGIINTFGGATDKMSDLTNEALKYDIMKNYITNRDVKQEWMYNKMFEDGAPASNIMGGLNAIKSAQGNLFSSLDNAQSDQLGYRNDYGLLRNNVLPSMQYGSRTNPLSLLAAQTGGPGPVYRAPSKDFLTGGQDTMINQGAPIETNHYGMEYPGPSQNAQNYW